MPEKGANPIIREKQALDDDELGLGHQADVAQLLGAGNVKNLPEHKLADMVYTMHQYEGSVAGIEAAVNQGDVRALGGMLELVRDKRHFDKDMDRAAFLRHLAEILGTSLGRFGLKLASSRDCESMEEFYLRGEMSPLLASWEFALHLANFNLEAMDTRYIQKFLEKAVDDARYSFNCDESAGNLAIGACNLKSFVEVIVQKYPDFDWNSRDVNGKTALHFVRHLECLKMLLTVTGININVYDAYGRTPLVYHLEQTYGHKYLWGMKRSDLGLITELLQHPATDITTRCLVHISRLNDKKGKCMPDELLQQIMHHPTVTPERLNGMATSGVNAGFDSSMGMDREVAMTPLMSACGKGADWMVQYLLYAENRLDEQNVNVKDALGYTALMHACLNARQPCEKVIELLLNCPFLDVGQCVDNEGSTLFQLVMALHCDDRQRCLDALFPMVKHSAARARYMSFLGTDVQQDKETVSGVVYNFTKAFTEGWWPTADEIYAELWDASLPIFCNLMKEAVFDWSMMYPPTGKTYFAMAVETLCALEFRNPYKDSVHDLCVVPLLHAVHAILDDAEGHNFDWSHADETKKTHMDYFMQLAVKYSTKPTLGDDFSCDALSSGESLALCFEKMCSNMVIGTHCSIVPTQNHFYKLMTLLRESVSLLEFLNFYMTLHCLRWVVKTNLLSEQQKQYKQEVLENYREVIEEWLDSDDESASAVIKDLYHDSSMDIDL